ncbi:MAG: UbiA family prenyltransferase [Candidatus Pacebacteria bacterium]|nr:UbiA family prenyltransferase [Candidatus Paceibacterota bacterium]
MSIKNILYFIRNEFIYGGHLFALSSVSIVLMSSILLDVLVTFDFLIIVYLIFYAIYLNDHFDNVKVDFIVNSQRATYLRRNKKSPWLVLIAVFISEFLLFYLGDLLSLGFGSIIIIFGLLYSKYLKILTKKIVAFKNYFVALVWSLLVLFFFVYYSYSFTFEAILISLFIFLRILAIQILLDIRDIESDKIENLLTIPVLFGKRKSIKIIVYINILVFFLLFYGVYFNVIILNALLLFFMFPYSYYYLNKLNHVESNNIYYFLAVIEPIIFLFLVLIGSFLL